MDFKYQNIFLKINTRRKLKKNQMALTFKQRMTKGLQLCEGVINNQLWDEILLPSPRLMRDGSSNPINYHSNKKVANDSRMPFPKTKQKNSNCCFEGEIQRNSKIFPLVLKMAGFFFSSFFLSEVLVIALEFSKNPTPQMVSFFSCNQSFDVFSFLYI